MFGGFALSITGIGTTKTTRQPQSWDRSMDDVSRQTISPERTRGMGDDWTQAELAILSREDLRPKEMRLYLPHRTPRAIYLKRHRIGAARKYVKTPA